MKKILTFVCHVFTSTILLCDLAYLANFLGNMLSFLSGFEFQLLYLLILIYIFIFFKFRPKSCNIYVLPISFALIPLILISLTILTASSEEMSHAFIAMFTILIIVTVCYAIPFFILTLIIAVSRNNKEKAKQNTEEK